MFYMEIVASHFPYFNLRIKKTSFHFKDVKPVRSRNNEELCAKEDHTLRQMYYMAAVKKHMILWLH